MHYEKAPRFRTSGLDVAASATGAPRLPHRNLKKIVLFVQRLSIAIGWSEPVLGGRVQRLFCGALLRQLRAAELFLIIL
jgi:hypothetical protein